MEYFDYGIELSRELFGNVVAGRTTAYRMKVRVTRTKDVDPNIFLYRRDVAPLGAAPPVDTFVAICTPVDLEEIDAGEPAAQSKYYRTADIDMLARNAADLEEAWELICIDRDELVSTLQALKDATGTEISAYGTFD
jgi:hypothetical protein